MLLKYKCYNKNIIVALFVCLFGCMSCNKILDVNPDTRITFEQAFADDLIATSAARGIYAEMLAGAHVFSGSNLGLNALTGLSADELVETQNSPLIKQFEGNSLKPENINLLNCWNNIYKIIYASNSLMLGLEQSEGVTEATKKLLAGEALFMRAFSHFYLVNLFGNVPIVTSTDYKTNAVLARMDTNLVYQQVIKDLLDAEQLLGTEYVNGERVRPVKAAATALLARVYLYTKDWEKAEQASTTLIDDPRFSLMPLADITLSNNAEAIWQLHSSDLAENAPTREGVYFYNAPYYNALRPEFPDVFETGDNRKTEWIHEVSGFLAPYKYKVFGSGGPRSEYSTALRLAEQYLIRAEARIQQDDIAAGIADLNVIRARARGENPGDLPDLSNSLTKPDALFAVEQERRVELFTEWGHRWFDLKRWGRADSVLAAIKDDNWQSTDVLYPVPQLELNRNKNLGKQNAGY